MNNLDDWHCTCSEPGRMRRLIIVTAIAIASFGLEASTLAQPPVSQQGPVATFKSSIDVVRINAVVRNKKGRFVSDLTAHDFEVEDGGVPRNITDFRRDDAGVSIALLFDVSGSMESGMTSAREAATHLLSWLKTEGDEAAVFTFDTQLDEVSGFKSGMTTLPPGLSSVKPFGATSLHDAIAQTAQKVATRESLRRAIVVFTDGKDNASRLTPGEVSGIASSIDVPVYIIGIVPSIDNPSADVALSSADHSALARALTSLSEWTGGRTFLVSTISERSLMARQLIEELRHQYLIAFEASTRPGWHPLVIRMRDKELSVRARSGYIAGQSRPISQ
jgi:Ca-activated chloride channel homolog